jgi:glutathione S-transferase
VDGGAVCLMVGWSAAIFFRRTQIGLLLIILAELNRPDHAKQRTSALAELRSAINVVERQFLGHGKNFINGDQISLSDVHVGWVVRWLLTAIFKEEPGFGKMDFPVTHAWYVLYFLVFLGRRNCLCEN